MRGFERGSVAEAAQRSLYSAEDSLLQSRVLLATDYIALNKALYGGWDGAVDSARPEIVDGKTGPRLAKVAGQSGPVRVPAGFQAGERLQCDAIIKLNYLGDGLDFTMALPLRGTRPARA